MDWRILSSYITGAVWISNHAQYKVWYEIAYPFPNYEGTAVEGRERTRKFVPYFTGHVIIYPCCDSSWLMLVKGPILSWQDLDSHNAMGTNLMDMINGLRQSIER